RHGGAVYASAGLGHPHRVEQRGELLLGELGLLAGHLADGAPAAEGLLGDGGGGVVADPRRQRGAGHQPLLDEAGAVRGRLDAVHRLLGEGHRAGGEDGDRLQEGVGGDRDHHVELEQRSGGACDGDGKWLPVARKGTPVASATRSLTRRAKSGWVFTPVPPAVPPRAISVSSSRAVAARRRPRSTCPAQPRNSWPSRIGVASWRWV